MLANDIKTILDVTFGYFAQAVAVVIIVWEAYKKIKEMKKESDDGHDRRQAWDETAKKFKEKEPVWDKAVADVDKQREELKIRYDTKLADLEDKIILYKEDNDKTSEKQREYNVIIMKSLRAVLQGLLEQGCDGPVKRADEELNDFLENKL